MTRRPHAPLTRYYRDEQSRQQLLRNAFDSSARHYDPINQILSFGTDKRYRRGAIARAGMTEGMVVLDVGCGTGLVASYAADHVGPSGCVVGLDPSFGMLQQAVDGDRVRLPVLGQAEKLPFRENTFDYLTMSYALRHVSDLAVAFAEYHRVLKPGGRVLLLELTLPAQGMIRAALRCWMKVVVPAVAQVTTGSSMTRLLYAYCWDSFDKSVPPETILEVLRHVGFRDVRRHTELRVFSEYNAVK